MPEESGGSEPIGSFESETERLRIENLMLKQRADFERQFRDHITNVESQMNKGHLRLGMVSLVVLGIAWLGTYREIGSLVQKRIDQEFGGSEIKELISASTDALTRKIIQGKLTQVTDTDHTKLKCLAEKQGRDLFLIQCRAGGGQFDDVRGVCLENNGGETYYETTFPEIDCQQASSSNPSHRSP